MAEGRNLKSPGSESGKSKRTYHRKRYEELTFSDDFMFCKILENNEELCKELIELVLGEKIAIVHNVEKQKAIETSSDNKGVRLDVRVLADNRIFALEMQNAKKDNLPRRTRYYQSMVDIDISEHGSDYKNLMDSCIIFICNFDPFEQNICRYTVKPHIEELPEYEYNDGTVKIFLSATVANRESSNISEELQDFLQYVGGKPPKSDLTKRIQEAIDKSKAEEKWRREYMFLFEIKEEGYVAGKAEGKAELIIKMHKNGASASSISNLTEIPLKEVLQILDDAQDEQTES